jgi:hypothetical protein
MTPSCRNQVSRMSRELGVICPFPSVDVIDHGGNFADPREKFRLKACMTTRGPSIRNQESESGIASDKKQKCTERTWWMPHFLSGRLRNQTRRTFSTSSYVNTRTTKQLIWPLEATARSVETIQRRCQTQICFTQITGINAMTTYETGDGLSWTPSSLDHVMVLTLGCRGLRTFLVE